ncbi:Ascorbate transporter, chloroplastic, variant 4 [Sarracenia purpurea var. burkii]
MAIGSLLSNWSFGSVIDSGKVYQKEQAKAHCRGEWSGFGAVQYVHTNRFYNSLCVRRESYSLFIYSYSPSFRLIGPSYGKTPRSNATFQDDGEHPLSMSQHLSKKFESINPRQRITGICECCLASTPSRGKRPRKLDKLGISHWQCQLPKHVKVNMTRADYKSEEYDFTETDVDSFPSPEELNKVVLVEGVEKTEPWWVQFPKRWVIVLLCFAAFLLCNMDRVNMSIAILPMSQEFNWNSTTVGLIQSSFFWGYLLTQILGGIWADKIGGKMVLGFGVIWWSVATVLTPIAAKIGVPFLLFMRALMGIGEGVAMPAMNNILSKWIPVSERSRSLALVYSGMYLGSVTGLAFSPILIHKFGWPSVFYSFGSLGSIWLALWLSKAHSSPKEDPDLSADEKRLIFGSSNPKEPVSVIPWKLILSKAPVWALIISHFCHNWGTFILLTWMPTYYNQVLKFNLTESGLLCVLPWLTMAVFANIGGWIADTLVSKGLSLTVVRKIMQSIGFLGPAFFLTQLSHVKTPALAVLCMACSQGSDAFSQSGLYSNHQDIGPRYAVSYLYPIK